MIQHTYIFDTNVYGELLIEINSDGIIEGIKKDKNIYVYGIDIIENELRESPTKIMYKGRLLREAVLAIYRTIVDDEFRLFPVAKYLAFEYFKKFDELRKIGKYSQIVNPKLKKYTEEDLKVDFQIIAVASLKDIDIVVSTDKRTILSNLAEYTYNKVNKVNGLRTPRLVKYSDFKNRYVKW